MIVPELQAHGRTADIDRPITYEGMADDVAALIGYLGLGCPDVFGFSMGGGALSSSPSATPRWCAGWYLVSASFSERRRAAGAERDAPDHHARRRSRGPLSRRPTRGRAEPRRFPQARREAEAASTRDALCLAGRRRPGDRRPRTMIVVGDTDVVRLEHAVELFRLLGGGAMGDLAGFSKARLVVFPGTSHFIPPGSGVMDRAEWLLAMVPAFLDAPVAGDGGRMSVRSRAGRAPARESRGVRPPT